MSACPHQPSPTSKVNKVTVTMRARLSGRPARADHSHAPMSAIASMASANSQAGAKKINASTMGAMTSAVMTRVLSTLPLSHLLAGLAEAALPYLEPGDGLVELELAEIRPQDVSEIQFRVSEVPQQEVADAFLTTGADEKIRVGAVTQGHGGTQGRLIGCLESAFGGKPSRCIQDV